MSKITLDTTDMTAIGDVIRTKLDVETPYKAGEMPAAILSIPGGGITPTGTISIGQNGTYDVTQYASAEVNVSGSGDDPFALTDYIESSGTQYIDTGYIVKDNSKFEAVALVNKPNIQWGTLFGTRNAPNVGVCMFGAYGYSEPGVVVCWGGAQAENTGNGVSEITGTKTVYTLQKQNFGLRNPDYTIGGYPAGRNTINNPYSVFLFDLNSAGTAVAPIIAKLYRFRIYEDETMVMELLPAMDGDTVCLRDTVSGQYFYNAGTGSFTYGSDNA